MLPVSILQGRFQNKDIVFDWIMIAILLVFLAITPFMEFIKIT